MNTQTAEIIGTEYRRASADPTFGRRYVKNERVWTVRVVDEDGIEHICTVRRRGRERRVVTDRDDACNTCTPAPFGPHCDHARFAAWTVARLRVAA